LFLYYYLLVRRRALHKYDPEDLQKSVTAEAEPTNDDFEKMRQNHPVSVQDQELAQAKSAGLLVAFNDAAAVSPQTLSTTTTSPSTSTENASPEMNDLDQWDQARGEDAVLYSDDEDSDDDLL
jgi:hypothetical protein